MSNAFAEKLQRFKAELTARRDQILSQLPASLRNEAGFKRFHTALIQAVVAQPKLLDCTRVSLLRAAMEAAESGLSLNSVMREADILPGYVKGESVAQFRPRYAGYIKLARRSGEVKNVYAEVVHANDEFEWTRGTDPKIVHRPALSNRGKPTHVYAVWEMSDGTKTFEVMDEAQINIIRDRSEGVKAKNAGKIKSTPWDTDPGEMWRKTVIRRSVKYVPMALREEDAFTNMVHRENMYDAGEPAQDITDVAEEPPVADTTPRPSNHGVQAVAQLEHLVDEQELAVLDTPMPKQVQGQMDWVNWAKSVRPVLLNATDVQRETWRHEHAELLEDCHTQSPNAHLAIMKVLEN